MKNMERKESILLYNYDLTTESGKKAKEIFDEMNLDIIEVTEDMIGNTVGAIAGFDGMEISDIEFEETPSDKSFLIMNGMSIKRMEKILEDLNNIGETSLKAIVTPDNCRLSFGSLTIALEREYNYMNLREELQKAIKDTDLSKHDASDRDRIYKALTNAKKVLKAKKSTVDDFTAALEALKN